MPPYFCERKNTHAIRGRTAVTMRLDIRHAFRYTFFMSCSRTIAIGDIHGCRNYLDELLKVVQPTHDDTLVFLGDYVDRGTDIPGTITRLCEIKDMFPHTVFLRGNHDAMLCDVIETGGKKYGKIYRHPSNGGHVTLLQYGCPRPYVDAFSFGTLSRKDAYNLARDYIPEEHKEFLLNTTFYHICEPYLFVHAGVHPSRRFKTQKTEDFMWIRDPFLTQDHRLPYTVIYGHTPTFKDGFLPRMELAHKRIGIDTGAVYGGSLCALTVPSLEYVLYPSPDACV